VVSIDLNDVACHAVSDFARLALLVRRGLVECRDAKVESGARVGVRSSWCPKESVHIQGEPTGPALGVEDAADDDAVGEHVEVVIVPLAGWAVR
jgi:hypothetical protein